MPLRFVRQLRNNTAQSLVLFVKLGTYPLVALRLEAPNKHIPLIRAPLTISIYVYAFARARIRVLYIDNKVLKVFFILYRDFR